MYISTITRNKNIYSSRGSGYAAKDGEKDDPVMATLLVVRIVQQVAQYDENAYDELRDTSVMRTVEPMHFVFNINTLKDFSMISGESIANDIFKILKGNDIILRFSI